MVTESAQFTKIRWANLDFIVTARTFIPRNSSLGFLEVVDQVCNMHSTPKTLIDMCCGSGALGIAAYLSRPGRFRSALFLDSSPDAVLSCELNRVTHKVPGEVRLWRAGEPLPACEPAVVLCNPPFLDDSQSAELPEWEQTCVSCAANGTSVMALCFNSVQSSEHLLVLKCLVAQKSAVAALARAEGRSLRLAISSGETLFSVWASNAAAPSNSIGLHV